MNRDLPPNVHRSGRGFFYVVTKAGKQRWLPLTKERTSSLAMAENIRKTLAGSADNSAVRSRLRRSWSSARWRAKKFGMPFDLPWAWVMERADRQGWCCAMTALPFAVAVYGTKDAGPLAPSLDRILPSAGYTRDNVRIICLAINYALNEWGEDCFEHMARAYLRAKGAKT